MKTLSKETIYNVTKRIKNSIGITDAEFILGVSDMGQDFKFEDFSLWLAELLYLNDTKLIITVEESGTHHCILGDSASKFDLPKDGDCNPRYRHQADKLSTKVKLAADSFFIKEMVKLCEEDFPIGEYIVTLSTKMTKGGMLFAFVNKEQLTIKQTIEDVFDNNENIMELMNTDKIGGCLVFDEFTLVKTNGSNVMTLLKGVHSEIIHDLKLNNHSKEVEYLYSKIIGIIIKEHKKWSPIHKEIDEILKEKKDV